MVVVQYDRVSGRHQVEFEILSEMHWVSTPASDAATFGHMTPSLGAGSPNPRGLTPARQVVEAFTASLDESAGPRLPDWTSASIAIGLDPGTREADRCGGYLYSAEGSTAGSVGHQELQGVFVTWLDEAHPIGTPVPEQVLVQFDRHTGEVEFVEGDAKAWNVTPNNLYAMTQNLRPSFGPDRVVPAATVKADWFMGGTRVPLPIRALFPHARSMVTRLGELVEPAPPTGTSWTLVAHLDNGQVTDASGWTYPTDAAPEPLACPDVGAATEAAAGFLRSTHKTARSTLALLVQVDAASGLANLKLNTRTSDAWDADLADRPQKLQLKGV